MIKNKKKNTVYNVGLIGCGKIGYSRNLNNPNLTETHFSVVQKIKRLKLTAISDTNKTVLNKFSKRNQNIKIYTSYKTMIKENVFDIIIVASPTKTHYKILKFLLNYKPRIVFCEKPVSENLDLSLDIINLYKKESIPLQINFTRRFIKEYQELYKQIIKRKKIGKIKYVNINYNRGFYNNGSHFLDLINWFFGNPKKVILISKSKSISYRGDLNLNLVMIYKENFKIYLKCIDVNKLIMEEIDIFGTKGRVKINNNAQMEYFNIKRNNYYEHLNHYILYETKKIKFNKSILNAMKNIINFLDRNDSKMLSSSLNTKECIQLIKNKI